jgi:hypothetical protein
MQASAAKRLSRTRLVVLGHESPGVRCRGDGSGNRGSHRGKDSKQMSSEVSAPAPTATATAVATPTIKVTAVATVTASPTATVVPPVKTWFAPTENEF